MSMLYFYLPRNLTESTKSNIVNKNLIKIIDKINQNQYHFYVWAISNYKI